jgi:hypothetical protein
MLAGSQSGGAQRGGEILRLRAEAMGMPEGTVRRRLAESRQKDAGRASGGLGASRRSEMREDRIDQELSRLFHESLGLTGEQEDALWARFQQKAESEVRAWAFFTVAMIRNAARLRPAVMRASWAHRVSHVR